MVGKPMGQSQPPKKGEPPHRRPIVIRVLGALKRYENRRYRRSQTEKSNRDLVMARWTRRVGIFTAALVVVGVVTAVIFWRQLNVMQGQLDEMRLEPRPWLTMDVKIAGPLTFSPAPKISLNVVLTNIGKSPAFNAWFNTVLFPFSVSTDVTKEIPQRCAVARQDQLKRQAFHPKQPGYILFPGRHIEEIREIAMDASEYKRVLAGNHNNFISVYALLCGDYLLAYSSPIHSTDLVFAVVTSKQQPSDKVRIIIEPENWNFILNPTVGEIKPDDLHLYQEPFGYTYAD
jgi:hypothetical protein